MNTYIALTVTVILIGLASLSLLRWSDHRADAAERDRLITFQPDASASFDMTMVAGLPEPAQRYFAFSIAPGTPLYTVADIYMHGQFSLGDKDKPDHIPMSATQTLAAPHGFVWKMKRGTWCDASFWI